MSLKKCLKGLTHETTKDGEIIYLKQIINNLLTNSIKYTKKGYIKLSINCINNKCRLNSYL